MRWILRRRVKICESRSGAIANPQASTRLMELETAKEILAEIFLIRPAEVEEMIKSRLEERNICENCIVLPEENGGKLWPATFFVGR